tara:strand:- start:56257 stop:59352 length:3096 start_codon:yes stop_codon:yes gene_type:complete
MSSYNTLYIDIKQSPSLLASVENVKLSSDIYYLNADRQQFLLNTADGTVSYSWLYSADGGQTFKTLNQNSPSLSLDVNTLNIQYIYKLKVSIDRNPSSLLSNSSDIKNIISNTSNNIILTNQTDDDSEVLYSEAITINHNLDLEDIIVDMALNDIIEQLGNEINFNNQVDNLELNVEYEESIEDTETIESVTIGADSPTGGAGFLTTTCYERRVNYFCGVKIDYCVKSEEFIFPGSNFVCDGAEICVGKCVVEDQALLKINTPVGEWYNTKIGNGQFRWCVGGVQTVPPIDSVSRSTDYANCADPIDHPERGKALKCYDPESKTDWYTWFFDLHWKDCAPVRPSKRGAKGADGGGCPGRTYNIIKKWCNPSSCPGEHEYQYKYNPFLNPSATEKQFRCKPNKYVYQGGCSCEDKNGNTSVEYGGGCAGPACTSVAGPTNIQYVGAITVNVFADPDGTLRAEFSGRPKLESNKKYTLHLRDGSAGNHNLDNIFKFTTPYLDPDSDLCDIHDLNIGSDLWGPCINQALCYQEEDIDPSFKCFSGDAIYKVKTAGNKSYSCAEHCENDDIPRIDAPIYSIYIPTTRPSSSEGLMTLSKAQKYVKDAAGPNDPYWIRQDGIRPAGGRSKCEYYCQATRKKKSYSIATTAGTTIGKPSLNQPCKACDCETNADCGGCGVCSNGRCIDYPSTHKLAGRHPCASIPGSVCCTSVTRDIGEKTGYKKTVTCADPYFCQECIAVESDNSGDPSGTTAGLPYNSNDPTVACCAGVKYDPRCKQCEEGTITDTCIPPKVCTKSGTDTWDDGSDPFSPNLIEYDTFSCIIPPCPHCSFEADDYEQTGNCIPYNGSVNAILSCQECEVISNPFYPALSDEPYMPFFTSTLDEGEECCQTGETTAAPSKKCCSDGPGDYSYSCGEDQKCCNGTCLNEGECCGESGAEPAPVCQNCEGEPACPAGTTCCTGTDQNPPYGVIFLGCADPTQCQECGSGWGNNRQGVRPTYDTSDPCLVCNEGSVDTITSDDPEDPCYSAPQSIFYEP